MYRILIMAFLLLPFGSTLYAQYINTDSLVIIPGSSDPITISEFNLLEKQWEADCGSYLSHFNLPGNGGILLSHFGPRSGRMHYGVDLKMNLGDTVKATFNGQVIRAGYGYGFGNLVVIQHENNLETYYAHLSRFLIKNGDWVSKGEPIGLAGSTGRARGNHLHFEIREKNMPFDPEMVFDFASGTIREDVYTTASLAELHKRLKPKGYANNAAVPEYYKVRSGDSLWVISRRYKTSIQQICQLNKISESSVLQIGQPLRMY